VQLRRIDRNIDAKGYYSLRFPAGKAAAGGWGCGGYTTRRTSQRQQRRTTV
jgi:hypothetical protein